MGAVEKRLSIPVAAVLLAATVGLLVVLGGRSVVAGPDSAPAAAPPNPGHSWSEIGDFPGTIWHSNNDGAGSGLDADMVDGMDTGQSGTNYIPYADGSGNVGIGTTDPQATLDVDGAVHFEGWEDLGGFTNNIGKLVVWNGMLCGQDGDYTKCYDGSSWNNLGTPGSNVRDIAVWNDMICAFVRDVAVYCYKDGSWTNYGKYSSYMWSYDVTTWNGKLCVGHALDAYRVNCRSVSGWSDLGYYTTGDHDIRRMTSWNGKLCVSDASGYIECYDGSWENIADFDAYGSLTVWQGRLCTNDGTIVKCYDGTSWEDIGTSGEGAGYLAVWNGKLCGVAGGSHVKCYDGSMWEDLGDLGSTLYRLTAWNGKLCAGDGNQRVKCYVDSDGLDNYWYKQGSDISYDYDVHAASLISDGNVGIGTTSPNAKLHVSGGDAAVSTQGNGVILRATDGANCYRLTVNNTGTVSTALVSCP